MADSGADAFFVQLQALYQAAGAPQLERMVRYCGARRPPVRLGSTTLHDWLRGRSAPAVTSQRAFFLVLRFLQEEARRRDSGYLPRSERAWADLLRGARTQRSAHRGGRPRKRAAAQPEEAAGPVTLPADPPDFAGRDAEVRALLARLDPADDRGGVISAVTGMGGVGKTALAVHTAHLAAARRWFPGGVLFADVRGFRTGRAAPAEETAELLLRAVGVPRQAPPPAGSPDAAVNDPTGQWRSALADLAARRRPVLVLLDNAATADQVAALVPGPPHRLLVTSRSTLSALPAHRTDLSALDAAAGAELLDRALRRFRPDDRRIAEHPSAATLLSELCGGLPLALRIVAALLGDDPYRLPADQAADLAAANERLERLSYQETDLLGRPLAVRAAFDLSYDRLGAEAARAFRLLGLLAVPDTGFDGARALLGHPDAETRRLLSELSRLHLLQGRPGGRWDMHDLIRLYAAGLAGEQAAADGAQAALRRLGDHFQEGVKAANALAFGRGSPRADPPSGPLADPSPGPLPDPSPGPRPGPLPGQLGALDWLAAEHRPVAALITAAHQATHWQLACALTALMVPYWELRRHTGEWTTAAEAALDAAGHLGGDSVVEASMALGNAYRVARRYDGALPHLLRAVERAPNRAARGAAQHNLGLTCFRMGRYAQAEELHRQDLRFRLAAGDGPGAAESLVALGDALRMLDRYDEAARMLQAAVDAFQERGDAHNTVRARVNLALALTQWRPGWYSSCGIWHLCQALRTQRELGDHLGQAHTLADLAAVCLRACPACFGRVALDCAQRAARLAEEHGDPYGHATAAGIAGQAMAAVGDPTGARRQLERARAAFEALDALPHAERIGALPAGPYPKANHVLGCLGRGRTAQNLFARMAGQALAGDYGELDAVRFIDFRFAV